MRSLLFEVIRFAWTAEILCNGQSIAIYNNSDTRTDEEYITKAIKFHTEDIINIIGGK